MVVLTGTVETVEPGVPSSHSGFCLAVYGICTLEHSSKLPVLLIVRFYNSTGDGKVSECVGLERKYIR